MILLKPHACALLFSGHFSAALCLNAQIWRRDLHQESIETESSGLEGIVKANNTGNRRHMITSSIASLSSLCLMTNNPQQCLAKDKSIARLLEEDGIVQPPPSRSMDLNKGIDNMYYPPWMEGEWDLTQTLKETKTPLGLKFIGGPSGSEKIALETMKEQEMQTNKPVKLRVRYLKTKFGVAEDRLFNLRSRLDAFAGRTVVSSVQYADVGGSNRQSVLALGGTERDPLQTTVVYFKGPAAQKAFMIAHDAEYYDASPAKSEMDTPPSWKVSDVTNRWAGFELSRSIFALTNQSTAPPVTTDTQLIWYLEQLDENRVEGRLRICDFLNPQQSLYFEAKNKAVSITDYSLVFRRAES